MDCVEFYLAREALIEHKVPRKPIKVVSLDPSEMSTVRSLEESVDFVEFYLAREASIKHKIPMKSIEVIPSNNTLSVRLTAHDIVLARSTSLTMKSLPTGLSPNSLTTRWSCIEALAILAISLWWETSWSILGSRSWVDVSFSQSRVSTTQLGRGCSFSPSSRAASQTRSR